MSIQVSNFDDEFKTELCNDETEIQKTIKIMHDKFICRIGRLFMERLYPEENPRIPNQPIQTLISRILRDFNSTIAPKIKILSDDAKSPSDRENLLSKIQTFFTQIFGAFESNISKSNFNDHITNVYTQYLASRGKTLDTAFDDSVFVVSANPPRRSVETEEKKEQISEQIIKDRKKINNLDERIKELEKNKQEVQSQLNQVETQIAPLFEKKRQNKKLSQTQKIRLDKFRKQKSSLMTQLDVINREIAQLTSEKQTLSVEIQLQKKFNS